METLLCSAVGTASHQPGLEACTVCMVDLEPCWQMTKLYRTYVNLTHLCLTFHYWSGSDMEVIYFVLRKVIAKSDVSHM